MDLDALRTRSVYREVGVRRPDSTTPLPAPAGWAGRDASSGCAGASQKRGPCKCVDATDIIDGLCGSLRPLRDFLTELPLACSACSSSSPRKSLKSVGARTYLHTPAPPTPTRRPRPAATYAAARSWTEETGVSPTPYAGSTRLAARPAAAPTSTPGPFRSNPAPPPTGQ